MSAERQNDQIFVLITSFLGTERIGLAARRLVRRFCGDGPVAG